MGDICCFNIFSVVQINKDRDLTALHTRIMPISLRRYIFVECFLLCAGDLFLWSMFLLCPGDMFLWSMFPVVSRRYVFVEYVSCCVQEIRFCVEYVSCCVQEIVFVWSMFLVVSRR